ncbi:hypothetical protein ACFVU3_00545 [Streptomyces sp. NPDC058052]|uniref:hypothetical protein n=1 Tax=Streptomyces sp. NPDC058052 TaxID=3346316 RepID=UPI0036E16ACA
MTTTRAALHLLGLRWDDLTDSLGAPTSRTWYGTGIRNHLADTRDPDTTTTPTPIRQAGDKPVGPRPIPIRLDIHETMLAITHDMRDCADLIASRIQIAPLIANPHGLVLSPRKAARRKDRAAHDAADPRRWPIGAALPLESALNWLTARVNALPGPFRLLADTDHHDIRASVRTALWRAEQALDRGEHTALPLARPCPHCGGQVTLRGPRASCAGCHTQWTDRPAIAA